MVLSHQERISLIECFYSSGRNFANAIQAYQKQFGIKTSSRPCSIRALRRLVEKFEKLGTVSDAPRTGRPSVSSKRVSRIKRTVTEISGETPHGECSAREVARRINQPASTVRKIMKTVLNLHPYKIKRVQELKEKDLPMRLEFARRCIAEIAKGDDWLPRILWSDEAHFHLHGGVNSHNAVIWAEENPHQVLQTPLHDEYVTVWCGFTADFIIGPYFFERPSSHGFTPLTVNGSRYYTMLAQFVVPALNSRHCLPGIIFQQDGAPPHIQTDVINLLRREFNGSVISRGFDLSWPPRSPDLSPADFFLWGLLKSKVYLKSPKNIEELKAAIQLSVRSIEKDQFRSAVSAFVTRIVLVSEVSGGHIEFH
jgi:hypothetical protein